MLRQSPGSIGVGLVAIGHRSSGIIDASNMSYAWCFMLPAPCSCRHRCFNVVYLGRVVAALERGHVLLESGVAKIGLLDRRWQRIKRNQPGGARERAQHDGVGDRALENVERDRNRIA